MGRITFRSELEKKKTTTRRKEPEHISQRNENERKNIQQDMRSRMAKQKNRRSVFRKGEEEKHI